MDTDVRNVLRAGAQDRGRRPGSTVRGRRCVRSLCWLLALHAHLYRHTRNEQRRMSLFAPCPLLTIADIPSPPQKPSTLQAPHRMAQTVDT